MHETIRQYAQEKLVESGDLNKAQLRHAEVCLTLILSAHENLRFTDQKCWSDVLEIEHDNIRSALAWSLSRQGDPGLGLNIAAYAGEYWLQSHRVEAKQWIKRLLQMAPASVPFTVKGQAMLVYGYLADVAPKELLIYLADLRDLYRCEASEHAHLIEILGYMSMLAETVETSRALLNEAVDLSFRSSHPDARYWIHQFCGVHLGPLGWRLDIIGAHNAFKDLLEEAIRRNDTFGQAAAYENLMHVAFYQMRLAQAMELAEKAIVLSEQVNSEQSILKSHHCLAEIAMMEGRLDAAHDHIEVSQDRNLKYGYRDATIHALGLRMRLALLSGDHDSARICVVNLKRHGPLTESAALFGLETLAALEAVEGRHALAAQLFGAIEAKRERDRNAWWPKDHAQLGPYIEKSRRRLGEEVFSAWWANGRGMTVIQALDDL